MRGDYTYNAWTSLATLNWFVVFKHWCSFPLNQVFLVQKTLHITQK